MLSLSSLSFAATGGLSQAFVSELHSQYNLEASAILAKIDARETAIKMKANLLPEEKVAIWAYTSTGYHLMNPALRAGKKTPVTGGAVVQTLQAGINKLPSYTGVAFRSTSLRPAIAAKYKVGFVVSDSAFTSASLIRSEKAKYCMNIKSKSGKLLGIYSSFPGEGEVLFAPNTKFKVLALSKKDQFTIIDLEEI